MLRLVSDMSRLVTVRLRLVFDRSLWVFGWQWLLWTCHCWVVVGRMLWLFFGRLGFLFLFSAFVCVCVFQAEPGI